jgi:Uma2 family endonuclease
MAAAPDAAPPRLMTAEALLQMPTGMGERYELVKGELKIMAPAGFEHGDIVMELGMRLRLFVNTHKLGRVLGAETGYILSHDPDTIRAPDVSFVSQDRFVKTGLVKGYFPGAPDLAVEVVSPGDVAVEVQRKVGEYFEAGTQLVWVVYPDLRQVAVFSSARDAQVLTAVDALDGGALLPGFTCPVAELFG